MYKQVKYLIAAVGCTITSLAASSISVELDKEKRTITISAPHLNARYITADDKDAITELVKQAWLPGTSDGTTNAVPAAINNNAVPAAINNYVNNHVTRLHEKGNLYTSLMLLNKEDNHPVAMIRLGRMPTMTKYDETQHMAIIQTFAALGIIKQKDPAQGWVYENRERVGNNGLADIMPVLPKLLSPELKEEVINIGVAAIQQLKNDGYTLPLESTMPSHVVALVHPQDPMVETLKNIGFTIQENAEYNKFYPETAYPERLFVYKQLG